MRTTEEYVGSFASEWSLVPRYSGREQCRAAQRWTGVRDHFLLHYVQSGAGVVRAGRQRFYSTSGSAFLYSPETLMDYQADRQHPWCYTWVGFSGSAAHHFAASTGATHSRPVIELHPVNQVEEIMNRLRESIRDSRSDAPSRAIGWLYILVAELGSARRDSARATGSDMRLGTEALIRQAKFFIEANFQRNIGVADVVNHIGLDRSYLGRRFRDATGTTMQGYLTDCRMDRARTLVETTAIPVGSIASSVGYLSYEVFERTYKKRFGEAPSSTRQAVG